MWKFQTIPALKYILILLHRQKNMCIRVQYNLSIIVYTQIKSTIIFPKIHFIIFQITTQSFKQWNCSATNLKFCPELSSRLKYFHYHLKRNVT